MALVRYACPSCKSSFTPAEAPSQGSYARCPNCGGLALPSDARDEEAQAAPAPHDDDESTPPEQELPPPPKPFASLLPAGTPPSPPPQDDAAGEDDSGDAPTVAHAQQASQEDDAAGEDQAAASAGGDHHEETDGNGASAGHAGGDVPAPVAEGGLFAGLVGQTAAAPSKAHTPAPPNFGALMPEGSMQVPEQSSPSLSAEMPEDPDATSTFTLPAGGGLFSSLLAAAPDLELSGRYAPIRDPSPPPASPPVRARPDPDSTGEEQLPPKPGKDKSGEWEVANTGMMAGLTEAEAAASSSPPSSPAAAAAAAAARAARAAVPPPTGDKSLYAAKDKETFSDAEFEKMVGAGFSLAESEAASPAASTNPSNWEVSSPGAPPPLRKHDGPPPPPPKKAPPSIGTQLAALAPIPRVASLGPAPTLLDGVTPARVGLGVAAALLLGFLVGVARAPAPDPLPTTGTAGANVRLAEARKLLSRNQNAEAVGVLTAALTLDAKLAEAHRDLGVAYARQEKWEEAAQAYENYLELVPKAPDAAELGVTLKRYRQKP